MSPVLRHILWPMWIQVRRRMYTVVLGRLFRLASARALIPDWSAAMPSSCSSCYDILTFRVVDSDAQRRKAVTEHTRFIIGMSPSWKSERTQRPRRLNISILSYQCSNHVHVLTVKAIVMSFNHRTQMTRQDSITPWRGKKRKIRSLAHCVSRGFSSKQRQAKIL